LGFLEAIIPIPATFVTIQVADIWRKDGYEKQHWCGHEHEASENGNQGNPYINV